MKLYSTYYSSEEDLKRFIDAHPLRNDPSLLIQVFTSVNEKSYIEQLLHVLKTSLPEAAIIGATTDGEIKDGRVSSGKTVVSFAQFEQTKCHVASVEHKATGYYSGKYLAERLIEKSSKLMIAFADGLHTNGDEFLNGISSVNRNVPVAGGHAADNFEFKKTYVFSKEGVVEKGAVAVVLNSEHLHIHSDYSFSWHTIGNELTVTCAEGNRIYTIDDRPAIDTFAYYLGQDFTEGLPRIGIEFPLIVNRNGIDLARAIVFKEDDGSLLLTGNLEVGEKVRIGFGHSTELRRRSQNKLLMPVLRG